MVLGQGKRSSLWPLVFLGTMIVLFWKRLHQEQRSGERKAFDPDAAKRNQRQSPACLDTQALTSQPGPVLIYRCDRDVPSWKKLLDHATAIATVCLFLVNIALLFANRRQLNDFERAQAASLVIAGRDKRIYQ